MTLLMLTLIDIVYPFCVALAVEKTPFRFLRKRQICMLFQAVRSGKHDMVECYCNVYIELSGVVGVLGCRSATGSRALILQIVCYDHIVILQYPYIIVYCSHVLHVNHIACHM